MNKTVASSLLIVCCLSGELQILKINGRNRSFDLVYLINLNNIPELIQHVKQSSQKYKGMPKHSNLANKSSKVINLHGISKLGDGRFAVLSNHGFTLWQV